MNRVLVGLLGILCALTAHAQDVKVGSIIVFGTESQLRFVEFDDAIFISWEDLNKALPNWFTVNSEGKVVLSTQLQLALLKAYTDERAVPEPPPSGSGEVIESRIDGEFEGWDGETIFKLQNGQIWQQAEYAYYYSYKYCPRVTIYRSSRGWIMKVEGLSKEIKVIRLR